MPAPKATSRKMATLTKPAKNRPANVLDRNRDFDLSPSRVGLVLQSGLLALGISLRSKWLKSRRNCRKSLFWGGDGMRSCAKRLFALQSCPAVKVQDVRLRRWVSLGYHYPQNGIEIGSTQRLLPRIRVVGFR